MKARQVSGLLDRFQNGESRPGEIELSFDDSGEITGLLACCPGCGELQILPAKKKSATGGSWSWDGNREAPSLSPSILHHCKDGIFWHGYLAKGEFEPC
jgi:hypothetical protein